MFRRGCRLAAWLAAGVALATEAPNPRYTGALPIQEWTVEETGGKTQSFSISQHPATGLIYVGNEAGVLEFDGVRWRRLPLPAGTAPAGVTVRGLTWDDAGRLWGGMDNNIVRYTADAAGRWQPELLRSFAPADEPGWGVVWETRFHGGFVWCTTTNGILRVDARTLQRKFWPVADAVACMGEMGDEVWFRHDGRRLLRARGGEIAAPPVPPLPDGLWVLGVARTADGGLQAEHAGGVLELRDDRWVPLGAELPLVLQGASSASRVVSFPDGRRVFSTRARTLVIADAAGRVLGRIAEPPGVNFGVTPRTFLDRDGGLWLANASGIRRAQLDHGVVRHGPAQGLRGGVRRMGFDGDNLLVASAQGLFVRDAAGGGFVLQAGSPSDGQALLRGPEGWVMAAGQRFGEWRAGGMVLAPGMPGAGLSLAGDPHDGRRVFIGNFNEFDVYRRLADSWQKEAALTGLAVNLYSTASDEAGQLWTASGIQDGLWRVTAPAGDWSAAKLERMDGRADGPAPRLPAAPWQVANVEGAVVVAGVGGVWREEKTGGRLVPDERFAGLPTGAATPVAFVAPGAGGSVYAAGALEWKDRFWRGTRVHREESWQFTELSMNEARGQVRLDTMLEAPDGRTLWLGGPDAAFSVDLGAAPTVFAAPVARWRGVQLQEGDAVVFGGATAPAGAIALPRAQRAVRLEFAAPVLRTHLGGRTGLEYRTRAGGVDRTWTAWSPSAARELTNLPPGDVQLELQARNHLGAEGPVAVLTLHLPAFWWETWWARALAALAGAGLVAAAVRGLVRRQFARRIALLEAQAAVQQERLRIARDMHDDLGSTLAGIVHLSGVPPAEGRSAATLARIHEAARDLVQLTRDIVWAATPQHDSLESLVEQLAAHAERVLGDRGMKVQVGLPAQLPEEAVGAAGRHDLFLAFKEAVNNAAKYSQAQTAVVHVELRPDALVISLNDDGVGFAPGAVTGTGHGLGNLRNRLAAHGGSAEITSVPGRGTTVVLRLPRAGEGATRS